jgi:hypothetical protein
VACFENLPERGELRSNRCGGRPAELDAALDAGLHDEMPDPAVDGTQRRAQLVRPSLISEARQQQGKDLAVQFVEVARVGLGDRVLGSGGS